MQNISRALTQCPQLTLNQSRAWRATHPLDLLPGHGALGSARPLVGVLVDKPPTCTKPTPGRRATHQETIENRSRTPHKSPRSKHEERGHTWGLDDPGLVGLGRVAVSLPVGQALHHLAAAGENPSEFVGEEEGEGCAAAAIGL
jgi:hypothetical protein